MKSQQKPLVTKPNGTETNIIPFVFSLPDRLSECLSLRSQNNTVLVTKQPDGLTCECEWAWSNIIFNILFLHVVDNFSAVDKFQCKTTITTHVCTWMLVQSLGLTSTSSKHVRLWCLGKNILTLQSTSTSHGSVYSRLSCLNNITENLHIYEQSFQTTEIAEFREQVHADLMPQTCWYLCSSGSCFVSHGSRSVGHSYRQDRWALGKGWEDGQRG